MTLASLDMISCFLVFFINRTNSLMKMTFHVHVCNESFVEAEVEGFSVELVEGAKHCGLRNVLPDSITEGMGIP